ncbi:MAG: hypothetical protein LJE85_00965 [Gammaproteobacteria bacterium]|nr:hypothetical protein [Gammaproteobacteria bacterium]
MNKQPSLRYGNANKTAIDAATDIPTNGSDDSADTVRYQRIRHIKLQLAALGYPPDSTHYDDEFLQIAGNLIRHYRQQKKHLEEYRCPADERIQNFLNKYFAQHGQALAPTLPNASFILDRPGLAEELSLPLHHDKFTSPYVESYRIKQGVLHNPKHDRRTTKGVFHIVEGGLAIAHDKKAVPVGVFRALLEAALLPPPELLELPFTYDEDELNVSAKTWVSLLLRPVVCPTVPNISSQKSMEIRFFAPASLVSNLDFVERIFGNGGDPFLQENDAALDIDHWTGHTGCVILAPHLAQLRKKDLGLPPYNQATERQQRDGMCWQDDNELYNDGLPFKITCRDKQGVVVTLIADNYFGYSKKEVKSQISYSANLYGGCEEEHSGGALAFASYNLGDVYTPDKRIRNANHSFDECVGLFGSRMVLHKEGYGVDKEYPDIIYVPEDAQMNLYDQTVSWRRDNDTRQIPLLAKHTYIRPCGYKVHMEQHPHAPSWRLIGTEAEGTLCHKPCTVSGGGKSEISKSISDAIISGALYVDDYDTDFDTIQKIFEKDYSRRFKHADAGMDSRSLLSAKRSLGSVIRLLTPSEEEYSEEYNQWLESIPQHIRALVFIIKRFYRPEWGTSWRNKFSVDIVNGYPGHELKYNGRKLVASYLRVGRSEDDAWRLYKLRQDFIASQKVQMADDITASVTVPSTQLNNSNTGYENPSVKLIHNCENYLFQRPDDAIHRGLDKQAEADLAGDHNFISNFQPLDSGDARKLHQNIIRFREFTQPMQHLIKSAADCNGYFVSSAHPRLVNGKPTPNVRYLQIRPDLANARDKYIAEMGIRMFRRVPLDQAVNTPVNAVLPGRRNNPPDKENNISALAVYNPIHYQELPELFMDFICSLTGKSPSTTGAGSEGALTKGPFNSLSTTADLNNALVSFILCGYDGFSSAAGYVGPYRRIDHDVSLLIPEIWCRLPLRDRDPEYLIQNAYLEKLEDFDYNGTQVQASRLGYRITKGFVHAYFGKLFDNPTTVFDEAMLKPETQDLDVYVDGIHNIVSAQRRVAQSYIDDGTIEGACPPIKALLYIMAQGNFEGKDANHPEIRQLFTREYLLSSDWYQQRLALKQQLDIQLWQKHIDYIRHRLNVCTEPEEQQKLERLSTAAKDKLQYLESPAYLTSLHGTIGADGLRDY